jgi:spore coat polysaccharide biosynthesis predicted glycosyltransferase SpsG
LLPVERVAFRCDGDDQIGAGHVARCIPLAKALAQLGWRVSFVGAYAGLAGWLLARAEIHTCAADLEAPCGVLAERYDTAILDSYSIPSASICDLARTLPVVTLAEANRCPKQGVLLDYHLDRTEPPGAYLLAGPSFAPIDPAYAGVGHAAAKIRKILVTVGASRRARPLPAQIALTVSSAFPDAEIVIAGGAQSETNSAQIPRAIHLPTPSALVDVLPDIDLAVTAAGLTSYELLCAGIPQVAIAIASNQRRVVRCLRDHDLAPCLDLTSGDSLTDLPAALERLRDPRLRRRLSERGRGTFDGQGARRAAIALTELYRARGARRIYRRSPVDG